MPPIELTRLSTDFVTKVEWERLVNRAARGLKPLIAVSRPQSPLRRRCVALRNMLLREIEVLNATD